jgi:hypothetical protein
LAGKRRRAKERICAATASRYSTAWPELEHFKTWFGGIKEENLLEGSRILGNLTSGDTCHLWQPKALSNIGGIAKERLIVIRNQIQLAKTQFRMQARILRGLASQKLDQRIYRVSWGVPGYPGRKAYPPNARGDAGAPLRMKVQVSQVASHK